MCWQSPESDDYFRALAPPCCYLNTQPPTNYGYEKDCKQNDGSRSRGTSRSATTPVARKAAKKAVKKVATKTPPKSEKSPAKKAAAQSRGAAKPSPDAIARAAYLNYRRRVEQGLPGDSHGDWLEAERISARTNES